MISRSPLLRVVAAVAAVAVSGLLAAACASSGGAGPEQAGPHPSAGAPTIVVTHPVLGAVVSELVGEAAQVEVLMPAGADPHDHRPSARDVERLVGADLVVANGLGLEEGLVDALAEAEVQGTPVFLAADHVTLRPLGGRDHGDHGDGDHGGHDHGDGDHGDHDHGDHDHGDHDHRHEPGSPDPHFWVDPLAMAEVVPALAAEVEGRLGLDLAGRAADQVAQLRALDDRARTELAAIPPERRYLVTGHESMGYFADRYDLVLVGALIPSSSSQAGASAAALADLRARIDEVGVPVIFNEVGTSAAVADAVADETGVEVVDLPTHGSTGGGSYAAFIEEIVAQVVAGLAP